MKVRVGRVILGLVLVSAAVSPGGAITNGMPDGNDHPQVGVSAFRFTGDTRIRQICTGTLIAPDLFLTAAHCSVFLQAGLQFGFIAEVLVSFNPDFNAAVAAGDFIQVASIHVHPAFNERGLRVTDNGDVAVYRLIRPVAGVTPASLPPEGFLDGMREMNGLNRQTFTAVGYGFQSVFDPGGGPFFPLDRLRNVAVSEYRALAPGYLILSQNDETGDGGTCSGDSGGPNFFGDTDMIVGITVQGDQICRATNVPYRLDIPGAREFLGGFVTLP